MTKSSPIPKLQSRLETGALLPSSDFDLNAGSGLPKGVRLRPAAVLIGLVQRGDDWRVILTERTRHLVHHPGQVAFPGGKLEPQDAFPLRAALREAEEEIGLNPDLVTPLGQLGPHRTVTGFEVTPVLAHVDPGFVPRPDPGEVADVFEVPFSHLMNPKAARIESRIWQGQLRRYYVFPWGPYYIWGATARILMALQAHWTRR